MENHGKIMEFDSGKRLGTLYILTGYVLIGGTTIQFQLQPLALACQLECHIPSKVWLQLRELQRLRFRLHGLLKL